MACTGTRLPVPASLPSYFIANLLLSVIKTVWILQFRTVVTGYCERHKTDETATFRLVTLNTNWPKINNRYFGSAGHYASIVNWRTNFPRHFAWYLENFSLINKFYLFFCAEFLADLLTMLWGRMVEYFQFILGHKYKLHQIKSVQLQAWVVQMVPGS